MAKPTDHQNPQLSADLLGYHLGLADEETRRRVEAAFGTAEALAAARSNLQRLLEPLDADPATPVPSGLADRILGRIGRTAKILPMRSLQPEPSRVALPAGSEGGTAAGPRLSVRDVMGIAAAILIFTSIFVPGYTTARRAAQQTACANNLRIIGTGYAGYAEAYGNQWPYAGALEAGATWVPGGGMPRVTNSMHSWKLVSGRFVPVGAFVCPGREGDFAASAEAIDRCDDFPDIRNNSISTNFVTRPWRRGEFLPRMPIAGDQTPLVDQDRRLVPIAGMSQNSNSHGRSRGQNVIRATLSVSFTRRPDVGIENDDIYRLIGVERYTGLERPRLRSDAFLIP